MEEIEIALQIFETARRTNDRLNEYSDSWFHSKHEEDCKNGIEILDYLNDIDRITLDEIQQALVCLKKVDDDDKLYIQCIARFYMTVCYALLHKWGSCEAMLYFIESAEIKWYTLGKDCINTLKRAVPDIKRSIIVLKEDEEMFEKCTTIEDFDNYLKAYPEGLYVDEAKKRKSELEAEKVPRNRITQHVDSTNIPPNPPIPIWVYLTIGFLLVAVTVLVCYIVFK